MTVGKNIKFFRKKAGMTQVKLAEKANISRSYLADIENNRYNVSLEVLGKIAKALNVSTSVLLGEDEELTNAEVLHMEKKRKILEMVNKLTDDEGYFHGEYRKEIFNKIINSPLDMFSVSDIKLSDRYIEMMKDFFDSPNDYSSLEAKEFIEEFNTIFNYRTIKKALDSTYTDVFDIEDKFDRFVKKHNVKHISNSKIEVPILGSISAGQPIEQIEYIEGYELVEAEDLRGRNAFCLQVKGDSMIGDGIFDGDTVIAVEQQVVTSSDIAVVAINGEEATLKRVKCEDGMCILMPSNPSMQPQLVPANKIHILGKVIQSRRHFE
ncbi:helix-turn-helix domain-containing protein [Metabacillus halosaccharovorans]|uniref:helix-turn-helix domain-containing protein n=1 Tax=Metabacillus halosaccharovorans TaxID=930124 RepID=UPI0014760917|nr:LexA family transcriptional regulator [Metabacillus halosaccharovorans]